MIKKLSVMLIAILIFSQIAFASQENEYEIILNEVKCENASFDRQTYELKSAGSIEGNCVVPFESGEIKFNYETSNNVVLKIVFNDDVKNAVMMNIESGKKNIQQPLSLPLQKGKLNVKIFCDGNIEISSLFVIKRVEKYGWGGVVDVDYTPDEKLLQTATFIQINSNVSMVRNAIRYINPEKTLQVPYVKDGITYVASNYFMEMLGVYCENDEKNYSVLLRKDNTEMKFTTEGCTITKNGVITKADFPLQRNKCTLCLPLRLVAQTYGMVVDYKDGLIVVDSSNNINNYLNDEKLIKRVKEKLKIEKIEGRKIYVNQNSANANDTNSGDELSPYKTINAATAVAKAGDTIIVHSGVYRETVTFKNDGTKGAPIVLKSADNEDVTISANDEISNFNYYKDSIYLASVPYPLANNKNLIFHNSKPLAEARHPNVKNNDARSELQWLDLSKLWGVQGDISVKDGKTPYTLTSEKSLNQTEKDYWKGGYFVGLVHEGWRRSMAKIDSSEYGKLTLDPTTLSYGYWGASSTVLDTDFGYIVGHMNALDVPEEWIVQGKVLYLIPPMGADMKKDTFEYKRRMLLMDLSNKKNIQIKGIKGVGGSINMKDSELCVIDKCEFKYITHFTWAADSRDGFIDNATDYSENGAQARGEVGIYLGGRDNVIVNSKIEYSAGAGLYMAGKYSYVANNSIGDCGYSGIFPGGIFITYEPWKNAETPRGGHAIYFNSVYNCSRSAINIQAFTPWLSEKGKYTRYIPMEIAYNDFYNGGILGGRDGGLVNSWCVSLGDDAMKTTLHNNLVWDSYAYDNGHSLNVGIYYDDCTQMLESSENIIFYTNKEATLKLLFFNHQEMTEKSINTGLYDWGSVEYGYLQSGKKGLTIADYPNGKFFKSGASSNELGQIIPKSKGTQRYESIDALLSENAILKGNTAILNSPEDYIKFENVDFGSGSNNIEVYFTGNSKGGKDKIIMSIDSVTSEAVASKSVASSAPYVECENRIVLQTLKLSGIHDVYIKSPTSKSVGIVSIRPFMDENTAVESNELNIKCEKFDVSDKFKPTASTPCRPLVNGIKDTWGGNYVCYENQLTGADFTKASITFSTKPPYSGNVMKIYTGSINSMPIGEFKLEGSDWNEKVTLDINLQTKLSKGIHDIYFVFEGDTNSSNVYTVTFKK